MTTGETEPFELRILGAPDLTAPDGRRVASVLSQPSRLTLLAYLALAPDPVTRSTVVADFWPESNEARARNALSQAVFYLRRSLGKDAVRSVEGDRLWVPPGRVWCDARELLTADEPSAEVMASASHDVLAGLNADTSQPLQEWLDGVRRRARARAEALERARPAERPQEEAATVRGSVRGTSDDEATRRAEVPPEAGRPRSLGRWLVVAATVALVVAAWVAIPRSAPAPATSTPRLAVLLPRVTPYDGAPALSALTLNAELIARLPERRSMDLVSAPYATSVQEFRNQLEAIGTSSADAPDWILDVSVVVTQDAAHVVALLYAGSDLAIAGSESFDQPFDSPSDVAIEVPRAIAEHVGRVVAEAVPD